MSRSYSSSKDKRQQRTNVNFEQYLYNASKPHAGSYDFSPAELEAELLQDLQSMRRQVRRTAQRLRSRSV